MDFQREGRDEDSQQWGADIGEENEVYLHTCRQNCPLICSHSISYTNFRYNVWEEDVVHGMEAVSKKETEDEEDDEEGFTVAEETKIKRRCIEIWENAFNKCSPLKGTETHLCCSTKTLEVEPKDGFSSEKEEWRGCTGWFCFTFSYFHFHFHFCLTFSYFHFHILQPTLFYVVFIVYYPGRMETQKPFWQGSLRISKRWQQQILFKRH